MAGPFYIDLNAGDDAKDGLTTGNAWKTIEKFTANARNPGEIAYVRANTTEIPAGNITFASNGTSAAPIQLIGCNATQGIDPWNDSSDIRPTINFNGTTNYLRLYRKAFWHFYNIRILDSHQEPDVGGFTIHNRDCDGIYLYNVRTEDNYNCGLYLESVDNFVAESCEFVNDGEKGNWQYSASVIIKNSVASFKQCIFDPHTDCGQSISVLAFSSTILFDNSNFSTQGANLRIYIACATEIFLRNTVLPSSNQVVGGSSQSFRVYSDGVNMDTNTYDKGRQWGWQYGGEYDIDESWKRDGGATQGIRVQTNTNCGVNTPVKFLDYFINQDAVSGGHTYRFYAKFPNAISGETLDETELWFQLTELEDDGTISKSVMPVKSWDHSITSWQHVDITYVADSSGVLHVEGFISKASDMVYIDPQVEIDP